MGFFKILDKAKGFLNKAINKTGTSQSKLTLKKVANISVHPLLSTDWTGLIYGVTSNPSNFLKDNGSGSYTFSQITSDDVQFK